MWAYGMRGDSAGDWGRSLEYELGANVPATRRACMLAISSSENPASRRDVIQDGGSPVYPSSTCMLCWKFHGMEMPSSGCGGCDGGCGSSTEDVGVLLAGDFGLRLPNLKKFMLFSFLMVGRGELSEGWDDFADATEDTREIAEWFEFMPVAVD